MATVIPGDPTNLIRIMEDQQSDQLLEYWQQRQYFKLSNALQAKLDRPGSELTPDRSILLALQLFAMVEDNQCERAQKALENLLTLRENRNRGFFYYLLNARISSCLGDVESALNSIDSMHLLINNSDPHQLFHFHETRAFFFRAQGMYGKKLVEAEKALMFAEIEMNDHHQMKALYHLGFVLAELRDYQRAVGYLQRGRNLAEKASNPVKLWRFIACEGICQVEMNSFQKGRELLEQASDLGNTLGMSLCCGNYAFLAKALYMTGDKEEALEQAMMAWESVGQTDDLRDRRNVLHAIYDIFKSAEKYELALEVKERMSTNRDALYARQYDRMVAEMETLYKVRETALTLAEREQLLAAERARTVRNRGYIWIAFGFSVLLLAVIGLIIVHLKTRRKIALELENKNRELRNLDASKNKFFEDLSHEFRTPLTLIIGELQQLKEAEKKPQVLKRIENALRSGERLKDLFTQILDLSELQTCQLAIKTQTIHFTQWFDMKVGSFKTLVESSNTSIYLRGGIPEGILLTVDIDKIEKIVDNLIYNAYKHVDANGEIECRAELTGLDKDLNKGTGQLSITVTDTGPGIPDNLKENIFKRRVKGELPSAMIQGYGLGLSLSFELAELMKGRIELVESKSRGASFILSIPVQWVAEKIEVMAQSGIPKSKSLAFNSGGVPDLEQHQTVLIVEDHQPSANYFSEIISTRFHCISVNNANEAMSILMARKVDLVLTDIQMTGMDGFEFVEKIRKSGMVFKNIPIVILSGAAGQRDKLKGFEAGADEYLTKPINNKLLLARIDSLLKQWTARSKTYSYDYVNNAESEDQKKLLEAERIIVKNIGRGELAVSGLALQLDVSKRTLERLFKKHLNTTPVSYIKMKRLEVAYQLLEQGRYGTVSEVREMVGILNASYFSRAFRNKFGCNPSELLEKNSHSKTY